MLRSFRGLATLIALAGALGGCAAGAGVQTAAFTPGSGGNTIAFESIDGPPPQVFDRLVQVLDTETRARNMPVVGREAQAAYRIRSYLSAQVKRGQVTFAWVWDVYDGNQQRVVRLSGEEPAGKAGSDAWAAADDAVLRRIAQAGVSGLSAFASGRDAPDAAPSAPTARGPAIAFAAEPDASHWLPSNPH